MNHQEFEAHVYAHAKDGDFDWAEVLAFIKPVVSKATRSEVTQWKEHFRLANRVKNSVLGFDIAINMLSNPQTATIVVKYEDKSERLTFVSTETDGVLEWTTCVVLPEAPQAEPLEITDDMVKKLLNTRVNYDTVRKMLTHLAASAEVLAAVNKKRNDLALEIAKLPGEPAEETVSFCIVGEGATKSLGLQIIGCYHYAIINMKLNRHGMIASVGPITKPVAKPVLRTLINATASKPAGVKDMIQYMALLSLDDEAYQVITRFLNEPDFAELSVTVLDHNSQTPYYYRLVVKNTIDEVVGELLLTTENDGVQAILHSADASTTLEKIQAIPAEASAEPEPEPVRPFTLADLGRRPSNGYSPQQTNKLNWHCAQANLGRRLTGNELRAIIGQVGLNNADQHMFDITIGRAVKAVMLDQATHDVWYRLDMQEAGTDATTRQFEVQVITAKHVNTVRFHINTEGRPAPSNSEVNDKPSPLWLCGNVNFSTYEVLTQVTLFANREEAYGQIVGMVQDISSRYKNECMWRWEATTPVQSAEEYKLSLFNPNTNGQITHLTLHWNAVDGLTPFCVKKDAQFPLESYYNVGLSREAFAECLRLHSVSDDHARNTYAVFMKRVNDSIMDTTVLGAILPPIGLTPPSLVNDRVLVSVGGANGQVVMTLGLINGRLSTPDQEMPRYHTRHRAESLAQANKGAEMPQPDPMHVHDVLVAEPKAPEQEEPSGRLLFERVTANKAKEYIGMVVTGQPLWKMTQLYQFISTMAVVSANFRYNVEVSDRIFVEVVDTARTINNCVAELTLAR